MTHRIDHGFKAMKSINLIELSKLSPQQRKSLMLRTESDLSTYANAVLPIIEDVRNRGDAALVHYAAQFEGAAIGLDSIRVSPAEFDAAFAMLDPKVVAAIEYGIENIRSFHTAQKPVQYWMKELRPGAFAGERITPVDTVALYVPRGKGSFPSTVMMLCVPAVVAQVPTAYILTPAGPDGRVDAATLVAARLAGIETIFKVGGSQAVAAAAFGTSTIPKADKILGPGSPWVMAAKRALVDHLDPGIPAGPSESIVFADASADARLAALDVLIEAEHGPDSSAFLVTTSRAIAAAAIDWIAHFWNEMSARRVEFSATVLTGPRGGVLLADSVPSAMDFINDYAPEHLEILGAEPFGYLHQIRNAGEILLGHATPMSIANFVLGPNAVLPTSFGAKTVSALSVHDFIKRTSIGYVTTKAFPPMAAMGRELAIYEGFDAHALALAPQRFDPPVARTQPMAAE